MGPMGSSDLFDHDRQQTETNRENLFKNRNLLYWYENLYKTQFEGVNDPRACAILEIGSGTSPLQHFYKNVVTSDVMRLPYLDHTFDCHQIDRYAAIPDGSMDIISMTNVLHHLQDPLACLRKMAVKLKPGGCVLLGEPYFSFLSRIIYTFHHEPSVFSIDAPVLREVKGPLSSANMAIPHMIFFSDKGWDRQVADIYDLSKEHAVYYTALSYMITGGISRRVPLPEWLYRKIFTLDLYLSRRWPGIFCSFFIIKLVKRRSL